MAVRGVSARDEDELRPVSEELKTALREHLGKLKDDAVVKLVKRDQGFKEKRAASQRNE